jgi:hypothetical protein
VGADAGSTHLGRGLGQGEWYAMVQNIGKYYPLVNWQFAIENGPVETVDLPIENCDFSSFFVCLPEGKWFSQL